MLTFKAFWCRVWHFKFWFIGRYQMGQNIVLTGCLCHRCGVLHVFAVEEPSPRTYDVASAKRFEL